MELDFFDRAPISYRIDVHLPVSPARAWAELTRQNTLDWCKAIKGTEYVTPPPYGVGTRRRATLAPGGLNLSEYFFDWQEDADAGRYRNAFRVESASVPGIRRFGELTEVTPADVGCRLVWLFGLELPSSSRLVSGFSQPVAAQVFSSVETDTIRYFAKLTPQS